MSIMCDVCHEPIDGMFDHVFVDGNTRYCRRCFQKTIMDEDLWYAPEQVAEDRGLEVRSAWFMAMEEAEAEENYLKTVMRNGNNE